MASISRTTVKAPPNLDGWLFCTGAFTLILGVVDFVISALLWIAAQSPNEQYGWALIGTTLLLVLFAIFFIIQTKGSEHYMGEKWGPSENAFMTCIAISIVLTGLAGWSVLNHTPIPLIGWVPVANIVLAIVGCALYGELGTRSANERGR